MSLKFSIMITSVALAAILAGAWLADVYREHDSRAVLLPDQVITLFPDPKPLTAFALTDDKNRVFDLASLKGKWSFLFFGFTYCPDVCPTTLAVLARVRDNIAKNTVGAEDLQFVFVSVDPNRDTASKLGQYVEYFDTTFLGVTGDNAQIGNLASQLGAQQLAAVLSDTVGDVAVMAHEKEHKQHQHHADPENDRNFGHRQQFTRCARAIPSGKTHRE